MVPENQKVIDRLFFLGKLEKDKLTAKEQQLEEAIHQVGFTKALIQTFNLNDEDIANAIAHEFNASRMTISGEIATAPTQIFTESEIRKYRILPIFKVNMELTVAFVDPPYQALVKYLKQVTNSFIIPVITNYKDFDEAMRKYKGTLDKVQKIDSIVSLEKYDVWKVPAKQVIKTIERETDMASIFDELLLRAAKLGASDIHVEPSENEIMFRFRIDGVLQRVVSLPKEFSERLTSVIKLRAGIDMFERAIPQDGRMSLKFADKDFDVRVNSLPTVFGEKIVLRFLSKSLMHADLETLGFSEKNLALLRNMLRQPNGIILLTGPTGSGKTTTLYAALNEIRDITRNITTIENPVEYRLPLINQSQVNHERGFIFSTALRAILRQDPDIILIGEIRDKETGTIATEAAMTGHLVLSTLHTNSSIGAIPRLINIGIESFWVSSSMIGVIAQRLVRRLCTRCKEEYLPTREELVKYGLVNLPKGTTLFRSKGCAYCSGLGYRGRIAIHETLIITEDMRDLIGGDLNSAKLRTLANKYDFRDMYFDGIQKALAGITTCEEITRYTMKTY